MALASLRFEDDAVYYTGPYSSTAKRFSDWFQPRITAPPAFVVTGGRPSRVYRRRAAPARTFRRRYAPKRVYRRYTRRYARRTYRRRY